MMLDTQLSYSADFSQAWSVPKPPGLPEVAMRAEHSGQALPADFVRLGGVPDWVQDEAYPSCEACDADMVLLVQVKSLPWSIREKLPSLSPYCFADAGSLYLFTCPHCGTFKTEIQSH